MNFTFRRSSCLQKFGAFFYCSDSYPRWSSFAICLALLSFNAVLESKANPFALRPPQNLAGNYIEYILKWFPRHDLFLRLSFLVVIDRRDIHTLFLVPLPYPNMGSPKYHYLIPSNRCSRVDFSLNAHPRQSIRAQFAFAFLSIYQHFLKETSQYPEYVHSPIHPASPPRSSEFLQECHR